MILSLQGVFEVLCGILQLSNRGGGGVGEVLDLLLNRLFVWKLLQFGEGFGLGVCKAADEHTVSPSSRLSWQLKLLQLGDGRFDPLPTDDLLHLGC